MAFNLEDTFTALAAQIKAGISRDFNVEPWPNSKAVLPLIEIWPDSEFISYFETFGSGGRSDVRAIIRIYTTTANAKTELKQVSDLLSTGTGEGSSIIDAILADKTLDGNVETVNVLNARATVDQQSGAVIPELPIEIVLTKTGAQT